MGALLFEWKLLDDFVPGCQFYFASASYANVIQTWERDLALPRPRVSLTLGDALRARLRSASLAALMAFSFHIKL